MDPRIHTMVYSHQQKHFSLGPRPLGPLTYRSRYLFFKLTKNIQRSLRILACFRRNLKREIMFWFSLWKDKGWIKYKTIVWITLLLCLYSYGDAQHAPPRHSLPPGPTRGSANSFTVCHNVLEDVCASYGVNASLFSDNFVEKMSAIGNSFDLIAPLANGPQNSNRLALMDKSYEFFIGIGDKHVNKMCDLPFAKNPKAHEGEEEGKELKEKIIGCFFIQKTLFAGATIRENFNKRLEPPEGVLKFEVGPNGRIDLWLSPTGTNAMQECPTGPYKIGTNLQIQFPQGHVERMERKLVCSHILISPGFQFWSHDGTNCNNFWFEFGGEEIQPFGEFICCNCEEIPHPGEKFYCYNGGVTQQVGEKKFFLLHL